MVTESAAFDRAAPLSERLHSIGSITADTALGDRRLRQWRDREPFDVTAHWQERLASEGLDEESLARILGESPDSLQRRLGDTAWADWIPDDDGIRPEFDDPEESGPFFAPVACDLVEPALENLKGELAAVAETATDSGFDADELAHRLQPQLLWAVHTMLGRTMALELNLARERGELAGDDSQARFRRFLEGLRAPSRRRRLFHDYPVLARQLSIRVRQWFDNSLRMVRRAVADAPALAQRFHGGSPLGSLESISINAGDQHRDGQSVAMVRWSTGLTLVYKPRSMKLDMAFARLLDWLNGAGLPHPLRAADCLDRGEYGWSELIVAQPCDDPEGVRRFYRRQGSLLALLGMLRANDMHAENLIAVGEHPILIDLETLLQPRLPNTGPKQSPAEHEAIEATATSVLQIGLLPTPSWLTKDGRAVDLSGLGHRPGQRSPMPMPMLSDFGTDMMRVKMQRVDMDLPDHRPVAKDTRLNLLDYGDDIIAGYTQTHRLCRERRDELLSEDGPLRAFEGARVRVLVQSTVIYSTLLRTGYHPDVLRDALDRDRMFDFLWRRVEQTPALTAAIPAERRDLWRNDVPYFSADSDGDRLFDSDGRPIAELAVVPALPLVREALATWDDEHLAGQLTLIRGALAAATMNGSNDFEYPQYAIPAADGPASSGEFIEAATRVGEQLHSQAFHTDGSAQWLGLSSHMGRNWRLGPLSSDLFNGLSGVTLFLAELGRATGQERFTRLARHAAATIIRQIERDGAHTHHGMAGLPGIAYTLCRLAPLLDDESLNTVALDVTGQILPHVKADGEYDMVAGSAGTIAALRAVHALNPDGPAAEVIRAAAEHLAQTAEPHGAGVSWMPGLIAEYGVAPQPLAGFGHGTAGIAWALGEAAHLLGEPRYADVARSAIDYERGLFDPDIRAWRDVRNGTDDMAITAWCHGGIGIGLSRLGVRRTLYAADTTAVDAEIAAALACSREHGFGVSHSLCHGDAGALELFLSAATALESPELADETGRHAAALLRTIDSEGWLCGLPYGQSAPSLMVGLSGIGYQLLRMADPEHVPSVLTLAAPGRPVYR